MRRNYRKNKFILISLVGILLFMGVGYAAFQTKLTINGTANVSGTWNIRITSVEVLKVNGSAENVSSTYNDLTANLEANLYNKGDYVQYKITVSNDGSIDAKLENLGYTTNNNEAVKITSSGFVNGQVLNKGTTSELIVKIEYDSNYSGDASGTSGETKITLDFTQNS